MSDQNHQSDKIIAEQLGIKKDMRVWIGGHQIQAKRIVEPYLTNTTKPPTRAIDIAFIAPETPDEAVYFANKIQSRLTSSATTWIVFSNEMNQGEMFETLTPTLQQLGFKEKKKISINEMYWAIGYQRFAEPHP